jgi:hypothetical protein
VNSYIFTKTGPQSFPEKEVYREIAGRVWRETKKIILDNNKKIEDILNNKSHLIHETDSLKSYNDLLIHVTMYETFQTIESDRYSDFQFPVDIRDHLEAKRELVLGEFRAESEGKL